jgi:hypothetical protein
VRIDGRWRLIDATWGTGYLDERLRFFRDFQEHYFLTAPETFVFDHFPVDPRWQLVARPLSIAEFADLVYLRPMFFQAGFKVVSHSHARIIADDRVTVTLGVTRPVEIMAQVVDPHTDKPIAGEAAFAQVDETHAEINAAFPHGGEYVLRVFAKPSGTEGPLSWVLDYRVDAAHGTKDATFPSLFSGFETHHAWLYESLDGKLQPGQVYRFRLKVPGAIDVILENGGHRTALKRTGDEFSAELSAGRGESVLYARFGAGDDYLGLLKYIGK